MKENQKTFKVETLMFNENEMIYLYYIHYDATTSYVRKD